MCGHAGYGELRLKVFGLSLEGARSLKPGRPTGLNPALSGPVEALVEWLQVCPGLVSVSTWI